MKRRTLFTGTMSATALSITAGFDRNPAQGQAPVPMSLISIKPPMLKPGDRVGMVAPASNVYEAEDGIRDMEG